jgi:L-histidine Nalpha-methyltransferase
MAMSSVVSLNIHASQFPGAVRRDLIESLELRQVNHKFHYESFKQAAKWLALHQAYSPSRTDPDCADTYDRAFAETTRRVEADAVHLVGLGCGGGQKDARCLALLARAGKRLCYTPCDVSTALVLEARRAALERVPESECVPLVCDLVRTQDLPTLLETELAPGRGNNAMIQPSRFARILTFFGMIPNFDPRQILPALSALVRPSDWLLFSANLAPGSDYGAGVRQILPLYDNALTREWLMTFLLDLGVENADGEIRFQIEEDPTLPLLARIAAYFSFSRAREIWMEGRVFTFGAGDQIRLFFSYRHTPQLIRTMLGQHGLQVIEEWVTRSVEEGLFLVSRMER